MSRNIRVIVLCPRGRRETVNLSPNSSVLQILDEVCKKQNLNSDDFDVCHYNKPLDLSLPVRFANLPNNAQLELQPAKNTRQDCFVTVALQLESGERITKDFVPTTTILEILEQSLDKQSRISDSGEPVCIYMRQKLMGDALKNTTLRSLGLTKGSAIIRLMYRNPDDIVDQAHVSSPLTKPPTETTSVPTTVEPSQSESKANSKIVDDSMTPIETTKLSSSTSTSNEVKPDKFNIPSISSKTESDVSFSSIERQKDAEKKYVGESQPESDFNSNQLSLKHSSNSVSSDAVQDMDIDNNDNEKPYEEEEEIGAIHYIGGRSAVLYSLNDVTTRNKADLPDEFFDLTVEDVRYLMEEYRKARADLENQPLLTKDMRKQQLLQKLGRFKQTVIRIYFPERLVLQAVFEADETVQDVCDFVKSFLEEETLNFYLYTAPPKEKKEPSQTLLESMLVPAAVIYFGSEKQQTNYLKGSLRDKITDPRAAALAAYESRKQCIESEPLEDTNVTSIVEVATEDNKDDTRVPCSNLKNSSSQSSEKVPKWLKLSK